MFFYKEFLCLCLVLLMILIIQINSLKKIMMR
ncbi:Uncharacterised protein [Raoultella terrigena]|uniref:Uncharacterized protein n=1 Tax=Raoultella terrigena TaxID=577 RepID=A0A4V6J2G9_RAOTE|nr:Uncharacterised protein [Raoultella terrigena]